MLSEMITLLLSVTKSVGFKFVFCRSGDFLSICKSFISIGERFRKILFMIGKNSSGLWTFIFLNKFSQDLFVNLKYSYFNLKLIF